MMEHLSDILSYDPLTGKFIWLVSRGTKKAGSKAGTITTKGYLTIQINGKKTQAANIAWFMTYGYWPYMVDHENRIRTDNRLSNLREATLHQNACNRERTQKSGMRGVYPSNKKWIAKISLKSGSIYLGTFNTREEAFAEYQKQSQQHHKEFSVV